MSIQTQITRIQTARDIIRTKLVGLGLVESSANIEALATAVNEIKDNGAISAEVKEGETYTIPKGWHSGSGTISGVAGGGNYTLQSKTVTPTKAVQNIVPDAGSYGLSDVTVAAIPEAYQDVTSVTASAADVLAGKVIVDATGKQIAGEMPNNGAVERVLDTETVEFVIPAGYHSGAGKVSVVTESKYATPTKSAQTIEASAGKVLASVEVAPIPDEYQVVTGVTAGAEDVLTGKVIVNAEGEEVTGSMANNGAVAKVLTTKDASYTVPVGYHNGTGVVSIAPEDKEVTPTKAEQVVSASEGKVLNEVKVAAIPAEYQVVTGVTATADKVLVGSDFVDAEGNVVSGTMTNNGAIEEVISVVTPSVVIPAGFHNGEGKVELVVETKTATPTKAQQKVTPTEGKVLSEVVVEAIPAEYQDVTEVDVVAAEVLIGKKFVAADGTVTEGRMANNTGWNATIDGLTEATSSVIIPAGFHDGSQSVSLTGDIEALLAAI